jgi:RimJ/RimL family protein N-acetyltransferase
MGWATSAHGIRRFVASVSPTNQPSLAIVRKLGFLQTGVQWDGEDGEELVFELELPAPQAT